MRPPVYIDFETRSYVNLKKVGVYVYARDCSTEILCMSYAIGHGPVKLWNANLNGFPEAPPPTDLFEAIENKSLVYAHNANFERQIWHHCSPYDWPDIHFFQWRCVAAMCAAHSLPRALDQAGLALKLPAQKDMDGHRIMLKLSKPRKPSKLNKRKYFEDPKDYQRLFQYCRDDTILTRLIHQTIPELSHEEQKLFFCDWEINDRGAQIDNIFINKALQLIGRATVDLNNEIAELTSGEIKAASQREKVKAWTRQHGVPLLDTQGTTLDAVIDTLEESPVRRVIEICRDVNRTSTKKYESMRLRINRDGRARGTLLFHGANTGRWAGSGIQPHNFPRGAIKDMEETCQTILDNPYGDLYTKYDSIMGLLSETLRGAIIAGPGQDLLVADYSAIEARVVLWYGGEEHGLNVFRSGKDIYKYQAANIYNAAYDDVTKEQRFLGKQSILGLGFGMGKAKFKETCAKYGVEIEEDFSEKVVYVYRDTYTGVVDFWYECHRCVEAAIASPGQVFATKNGLIKYAVTNDRTFLYCKLPSGRRLAYRDPHMTVGKHLYTKEPRQEIAYMGVNPYSKQWDEIRTYGGKLVENIVQATARDIMASAILTLRSWPMYKVILSVHDELISEVPEGEGSLEEYENIVAANPSWANGLPIAAEGWRGKRYKK
jgi:DNA polymerase